MNPYIITIFLGLLVVTVGIVGWLNTQVVYKTKTITEYHYEILNSEGKIISRVMTEQPNILESITIKSKK